MSRVVDLINDDLKERVSVGQGWDGFYLWTGDDDSVIALNYMMNKAFDSDTSLRVVDEYYYDLDGEEYQKAWKYKSPSIQEMKDWLDENHKRIYKEEDK